MNLKTSLWFLLVAGMRGTTTVNASLRGSQGASESIDVSSTSTRSLEEADFVPFACNNDFTPCIPWTEKFGTDTLHSKRLVIECGECVTMDDHPHPGPMITLMDGIDIRGKLQITKTKEDVPLTIKSTIVVVQGELEMSATKAVDGSPLIHFIMEGEENKSFMPVEENSEACGGNECSVGKKGITVAGGKVDRKNNVPIIFQISLRAYLSSNALFHCFSSQN